jgi:hypothetical protein
VGGSGHGGGDSVKGAHSRQVGYGKRRVSIEVVGFNKPLEKIPTHLGRLIGTAMGLREDGCSKAAVASTDPTGDRVQGGTARGSADAWNYQS